MDAQILGYPPISGEYPEVQFDVFGDSLWVKFIDDDLSEWCGIFGSEQPGKNIVLTNNGSGRAFVVARSLCYWVNVQARSCLGRTKLFSVQSAIWPEDLSFAVVGNWTNMYFVDASGIIWTSKRIALDGIMLDQYSKGIVSGRLDIGGEERHFTLDILAKEISGAPALSE